MKEVGEEVVEEVGEKVVKEVGEEVVEEVGETAAQRSGRALAEKAGKEGLEEGVETVAQRATSKAVSDQARRKVAQSAVGESMELVGRKAGREAVEQIGEIGLRRGLTKTIGKAAASRIGKKIGAKILTKVSSKIAIKAMQMGGKYAMLAVTGPPGWVASAVLFAIEMIFLVLDIIDVEGYDSFSSNGVLEDIRAGIIGRAYQEALENDNIDWPMLFPITEIVTLDEFYGAAGLTSMMMRENYAEPNIQYDDVNALYTRYLDEAQAQIDLLVAIDPRELPIRDPATGVSFTETYGEDVFPSARTMFEWSHMDIDTGLPIGTRTTSKPTMNDLYILTTSTQKRSSRFDKFRGSREFDPLTVTMADVMYDDYDAESGSTKPVQSLTIYVTNDVTGDTTNWRFYDVMPDPSVDQYYVNVEKHYHQERDVYFFENLKTILRRSLSPDRADMLELVPFMSTANRYGITITPEAAAEWNTKSTPLWLEYNDSILGEGSRKPPEDYFEPFAALHTDSYYIMDPEQNYVDPSTRPASYQETAPIPKLKELKLQQKTVLGAPFGTLVAYCLKSRRLKGIAGVSPSVDPQEFGVTFDYNNGRCNYTDGFCTRYGLEYKNNDCQPYPGMGTAELIFGATITKGAVRTYKTYISDNITSGEPAKVALGLFYAANPLFTGSLALMDRIGLAPENSMFEKDLIAKGSNVVKKRSCKDYGNRYRDDGTSCWLDVLALESAVTSKRACHKYERNEDGTPGEYGNYPHGSLDGKDGVSCWQHTTPLVSKKADLKSCSNWAHKYGTNLRDDDTSCWSDTIVKTTSFARDEGLKSCSNWTHKYGTGLVDDGTSCWLNTITKDTDIAKLRDCKGKPLKDLDGNVIPDKYEWRDQVTLSDGSVVGEGRGTLRDDRLGSCWKDLYGKKISTPKPMDCKGPPITDTNGNVIEDKFMWRDRVILSDGTKKGEGLGGLVDDEISCWKHLYARESSKAKLVKCDGTKDGKVIKNWGQEYGGILEADEIGSCWAHPKGRGVGKIPSCASKGPNDDRTGEEQRGLLCYKECKPGYNGKSGHLDCEKPCPPGTETWGTFFCRDNLVTYGGGPEGKSCGRRSVDRNSEKGKALLAANNNDLNSLKHRTNIFGTCFEPCAPGTSLRSSAWGSAWCDAPKSRYTRMFATNSRDKGYPKTLRVCPDSHPDKDGALCYKKCDTVDELDSNNQPVINSDGTVKQKEVYDGIGPLCWPKGGAGIKKSAFERDYCEESENRPGKNRDNLADLGVCWDYCKEGDKELGLLCIPRNEDGKEIVGIQKTLMDRQKGGCGEVSKENQLPPDHPEYPRMRKNIFGVCWDVCKDGDDDWGAICNPKGGFGIKKNLFQRYYCEDENKKNILGVCWDKCPRTERDPDNPNETWYKDIGALCHPMGPGPNQSESKNLLEWGEGPGIKVPVWDREVCPKSEYQPRHCKDLYEGKLDETVARLEAISGRETEQFRTGVGITEIIENLARDGFTGENATERANVLAERANVLAERNAVWEQLQALAVRKREYLQSELSGEISDWTQNDELEYVALGDRVDVLDTELEGLDTELEGLVNVDEEARVADLKLDVEDILGCPKRRKNVAGICWDRCPPYDKDDPTIGVGVDYTDIGMLCHPKGGPGIKVPVWDREYCTSKANQPEKCRDIKSKDIPKIKNHLTNVNRLDISERIDTEGLTSEIYKEVETALDCPELRKNVLGYCWDDCAEGYQRIGALCQPKGGPGIKVPVWKREYCGSSSHQPIKCQDVSLKAIPEIKEHLTNVDRGDIIDRIDAEGLTDEIYKEVETALDCPVLRKKLMGVCWDTCPREVVPRNKERYRELRNTYLPAKSARDLANENLSNWLDIMSNDTGDAQALPLELIKRRPGSGNGIPLHKWSDEERDRYNNALDEYIQMKETFITNSGSPDNFTENCIDGFRRSASRNGYCAPKAEWFNGTAVTDRLDELRTILNERQAEFDEFSPAEFEREKFNYDRMASKGYNQQGVLCSPKSGTDDLTGKKFDAGPGIKVLGWEREYCRSDQKRILGVCWDKCKKGYRDRGALCHLDPNYITSPTILTPLDDFRNRDYMLDLVRDEENRLGLMGTTSLNIDNLSQEWREISEFLDPLYIAAEIEVSLDAGDLYFTLPQGDKEAVMAGWVQKTILEREATLEAYEGNNYIELIENRGLSSLRITENASAETKTMDDIREEMAALQNTVLSKSPIELFLWFQDLFDPERTLPWDTLSETDNQSILQDMLLIQEGGFPELLESAQPEVNVDRLLNNPIFISLFPVNDDSITTVDDEMIAFRNTLIAMSPTELFVWFQDLFDPERTLPWGRLSDTENDSILQGMLTIQEGGFPELLESAQPEVNVDVLLNNPIFTNLFIE